MFSIKCSRCGKPIISSQPVAECQACQRRRANGRRLAQVRAEQRTEQRYDEWEARVFEYKADWGLDIATAERVANGELRTDFTL